MEQNRENNRINGADSAEACVPLLPANSGRGNPSEPKTTQSNTKDDLVEDRTRGETSFVLSVFDKGETSFSY